MILGGGLLRSGNPRLLAGIEAGIRELGPEITVCVSASSPIVGAALLALDELGGGSRGAGAPAPGAGRGSEDAMTRSTDRYRRRAV